MTDREYIKLNTSIQTASNSDHLIRDEDGNAFAKIELRLEDNLFSNADPRKELRRVEMETTKLRLSMENTPIAQIPMDMELSNQPSIDASTCQLDVYPLCLTDNATIEPTIEPQSLANLSFPKYKSHTVTYIIKGKQGYQDADWETLYSVECIANTVGRGFPEDSIYYPVLEKEKLFAPLNHMLNLCLHSNHEAVRYEGDQVMLKNTATLEQMLQDALENAITFASTADVHTITVYLAGVTSFPDDLNTVSPKPHLDNTVHIEGHEVDYCFWYSESSTTTLSCDLGFGVKPIVRLGEDTLSIEYDTAPFNGTIPIIWNPAFVNTYDQPEQMSIDTLRKAVWAKPPHKRAYRYGMKVDEDLSYEYLLDPNAMCAVMNLIANKSMRDTFSFLPWCKVDTETLSAFKNPDPMLIPNFSNQKTLEPFYILDGTSAMITVSSPEPIMDNIVPGVTGTSGEEEQIALGMKRAITTQDTVVKTIPVRRAKYMRADASDYQLYTGYFSPYTGSGAFYITFYADTYMNDGERYFEIAYGGFDRYGGLTNFAQFIGGSPETFGYVRVEPAPNQTSSTTFNFTDDVITQHNDTTPTTTYSNLELPVGTTQYVTTNSGTETVQLDAFQPTVSYTLDINSGNQQTAHRNYTIPDIPPPFCCSFQTNGGDWHPRQPVPVYYGDTIKFGAMGPGGNLPLTETDETIVWERSNGAGCAPGTFFQADKPIPEWDVFRTPVAYVPEHEVMNWGTEVNTGRDCLCCLCLTKITYEKDTHKLIFKFVSGSRSASTDNSFTLNSGGKQIYFRNSWFNDYYNYTTHFKNSGQFTITEGYYVEQQPSHTVNTVSTTTSTIRELITSTSGSTGNATGNVHIKYVWEGLPVIVMSPLSSIVLILEGMKVSEEIQPVNAVSTASNLTQGVAVVENYFPVVTTLRDLHDELIIARNDFDVNPRYALDILSGYARDIKLYAKYITKDGRLHDLYIPPNGIFSVQLTFRVTYVTY